MAQKPEVEARVREIRRQRLRLRRVLFAAMRAASVETLRGDA
jgi:hypothetical protein